MKHAIFVVLAITAILCMPCQGSKTPSAKIKSEQNKQTPAESDEDAAIPKRYVKSPIKLQNTLVKFSTALEFNEIHRNSNVKLGAVRVNGILIKPGEVLSLNRVLGPRNDDEGYRNAPVITDFGKVESLGGGVCQIAGTLYNAALLAGLDIVKRYPHRTPVRYLPAGRDAAISVVEDLWIKNTYNKPIRLLMSVEGRRLICSIESEEELRYAVEITTAKQILPNNNWLVTAMRKLTDKQGNQITELLSEDEYLPLGR